ncbi:MAG: bifunctional oligoribonuclease/PAP phosphatase NrnA [Leptospiraceae bacterium]|nr:bifunctional oligoribonuclease/PAP phosphatase NrnA [Leptospiraceae bacterium]
MPSLRTDRRTDFEDLLSNLRSKNNFILTTHKSSDPDGIGSELGLYFLLESLGKKVMILNPDRIPDRYSFLDVSYRVNHFEPEKLNIIFPDPTVIVVDNSDIARIGDIAAYLKEDRSNLIVIDHHDGLEHFHGLFSFPEIGSTSEIIYELIELAGLKMDTNTAIAIYSGIVVDTGQFKYNKTRPRTHEIAAKLLEYRFSTEEIVRKIYEDSSYEVLFLKRDILATLEVHREYRLACIEITRKMLNKYNFTNNPAEGMTGELLNSPDIKISVSFLESENGFVKLSFRSKGKFDVCSVAKNFNGGGHTNASGATVKGELGSVKKMVLKQLKEMYEITQG